MSIEHIQRNSMTYFVVVVSVLIVSHLKKKAGNWKYFFYKICVDSTSKCNLFEMEMQSVFFTDWLTIDWLIDFPNFSFSYSFFPFLSTDVSRLTWIVVFTCVVMATGIVSGRHWTCWVIRLVRGSLIIWAELSWPRWTANELKFAVLRWTCAVRPCWTTVLRWKIRQPRRLANRPIWPQQTANRRRRTVPNSKHSLVFSAHSHSCVSLYPVYVFTRATLC